MFPRRAALVLTFFLALNLFFSDARAAQLAPQGTSERKLQRGFLNVVFSPLEISHALAQENKQEEWFNWVNGLGIGSWFAVIRAATGIYDLVTAPIPFPSNYEPTLQPEFALEHLGLLKEEG